MTSASRGQPNTTTCMTVRHDAEGKIATAENDTAARDDDVQPVTAHKRTYSLIAGKTMTRVSDDPQEDLQLWHRGKNIKNDRGKITIELIGLSSARPFHKRFD